MADADYDAVIIEMEHEGFSFTTLRTSLQVLLNRKRIAENGNLQPDVVPMVRIPPNARERNQWVIKQALAGPSLYPSLSLLRPLAGVIHTFWPINRFQRA